MTRPLAQTSRSRVTSEEPCRVAAKPPTMTKSISALTSTAWIPDSPYTMKSTSALERVSRLG